MRPIGTSIGTRQSLLLQFYAEEELEITDCFFRSASEPEDVHCDSELIDVLEIGN